jgi:aldose sugar dehydrogenase
MRGRQKYVKYASFLALLAAPFAFVASAQADEVNRCPPSSTQTIASPGDPGIVLVEGTELVPVRVTGSFRVPWSFGFLPDASFLVTERPGHLQHVRSETVSHEVAGVPPVLYLLHGGLLDLAIDPDFATNGLIYFSYLQGDASVSTMRVMRARYDEANEALVDEKVIFESTPGDRTDQIGGRIALSGDGYLFLTLGDLWQGNRAQDLSDHRGKIIRIKTNGSVPDDNPFAHRVGAKPEIWSYGHRNPQGLSIDHVTGELWETEHGPQGGDELNLILRGRNYGWPLATYGVDYSGRPIAVDSHMPGTEQPIHYWVPISIAPSGLAVVTSGSTTTFWMGTLRGQMVVQLTLAGNCVIGEKYFLKGQLGRVRDIRVDSSGRVYALAEGGAIYRLEHSIDTAGPDKNHL